VIDVDASGEWWARVAERLHHVTFPVEPVVVVWDVASAMVGGVALLIFGVWLWRRNGIRRRDMDKLTVMLSNWPMLIPGLVLGAGQYVKDYGMTPPTDWTQWKSFIWGAFIVVVFPVVKSAFTGSRPESGQVPKGTEAVLTSRTPIGMTSFLPPAAVDVVPLTSVGTNAVPLAPAPPSRSAPAPLVVPPAPPYPYEFKDGQWVFKS
jgi:hypothetical protein